MKRHAGKTLHADRKLQRVFAMLLSLAMVLTCMPDAALAALAAEESPAVEESGAAGTATEDSGALAAYTANVEPVQGTGTEPVVFGLGWGYEEPDEEDEHYDEIMADIQEELEELAGEKGEELSAEKIDGNTNSYNFYLQTVGIRPDDDENQDVAHISVYVRIPEVDLKSYTGLSAELATGNDWIADLSQDNSLWIDALWNYNGYSYYRVDLPLNCKADPKVGKFTVTNDGTTGNYSLYEVVAQYSIKKDGSSAWSDWEDFMEVVAADKGDSIRFRLVGTATEGDRTGFDCNPMGAARVVDDKGNALVGREWDESDHSDITPYPNKSIFKDPEYTGIVANMKTALGITGEEDYLYGGWGNHFIFTYKDNGNTKNWYPEFTVKEQGVNRVEMIFHLRESSRFAGDMYVACRPDYRFIQEGQTDKDKVLNNYFGKDRPDNKFDELLPPTDNKLSFYLCDEYGDRVEIGDEEFYWLAGEARYELCWRGMGVEGWHVTDEEGQELKENAITLKKVEVKGSSPEKYNICLEMDLKRIKEEFGYLDGTLFDPAEGYDLYTNFRVETGGLFWDYDFALHHEEEERDVLMFGLCQWEDFSYVADDDGWQDWRDKYPGVTETDFLDDQNGNALKAKYLPSAWAYMLENYWTGRATWGGFIGASVTGLAQEVVPVYLRVKEGLVPMNPEDLGFSVLDFQWEDTESGASGDEEYSRWIKPEINSLGTYDGFAYYMILLPNDGNWMRDDSQIPFEVTLEDGSKRRNFIQRNMVIQYNITKAGKEFDDGNWREYRQNDRIAVDQGDKIRFSLNGSATFGNRLLGEVNEIDGSKFEVTPIDGGLKDLLREEYGRDDYANEWEKDLGNGTTIPYYNNCYIFRCDPENDEAIYCPELTVKDFTGVTQIVVNANDCFGEGICGENIEFSSKLPVFALRQGDSKGKLIGGKPGQAEVGEEEEYKEKVQLPQDGILRFYLCDEQGKKVYPAAAGAGTLSTLNPDDWSFAADKLEFAAMEPGKEGEPDTVEAEIGLELYDRRGDRHGLHYQWIADGTGYYLQIDLSGRENTSGNDDPNWNNNYLVNDQECWLRDGFDLWLNFKLRETGEHRDWEWRFDYRFCNELVLRQQGNEGAAGGKEENPDRYNLTRYGRNTLLPTADGKLRFNFYELESERNGRGTYIPFTGESPFPDNTIPNVWLRFQKENGSGYDLALNGEKHGSADRILLGRDNNEVLYLEIDLAEISVEDRGNAVALDLGSDFYELIIDFERTVWQEDSSASGGFREETVFARNYNLYFSPVTVLGWNEGSNLTDELTDDMTDDSIGSMMPSQKAYVDAGRAYRNDGSLVLYIRCPKALAPEEDADFISLTPTANNPWVGSGAGKVANWFQQIVSVRKLVLEDDSYVYYQVRLKGTGSRMTRGAIAVSINGATYDFTLEDARAQYRPVDGNGEMTGEWTDVLNAGSANGTPKVVVAPGDSVKLNLSVGAGFPESGVLAMIRDEDQGSDAFWLSSEDMPDAARDYWSRNYEEKYGRYFGMFYTDSVGDTTVDFDDVVQDSMTEVRVNEDRDFVWENNRRKFTYRSKKNSGSEQIAWYEEAYADWGVHFVFTYEEQGRTKVYYPSIISEQNANNTKYINFLVTGLNEWEENNEKKYELYTDWACQVCFEKSSISLRYEGDLENDLETSAVPISLTGDVMKFYVYQNGRPLTAEDNDFGIDLEADRIAEIRYGGCRTEWEIYGGPESPIRLEKDSQNRLYVEMDTAPLKRVADLIGYDFGSYEYDLRLRMFICLGDDKYFAAEAEQGFFPAAHPGAKVITGTKKLETDEGEEIYDDFTFVEDGGTISFYLDSLKNNTFELNMMNIDRNAIDVAQAIETSSSDTGVVAVVDPMKYAGEDKDTNILIGNAQLKLLGVGSSTVTFSYYPRNGGKKQVSFTVNVKFDTAKSLESRDITLEKDVDAKYAYTGEDIKPEVILKDGSRTLTEGRDYELDYGRDCKSVGTVTLSITGKGNYKGTITRSYKIYGTLSYQFAEGLTQTPDGKELPEIAAAEFDETGLAKLAEVEAAEGYRFVWYSDAECTKEVTEVPAGTSANLTYYGKWAEAKEPAVVSYTVKFDMQGHGKPIADVTVNAGEKVIEPENPSEAGFLFGGWYKEAACANAWVFVTDTVSSDITLYAKWTEDKSTVSPADKEDSSYQEDERQDLKILGAAIVGLKDKNYDGKPYLPVVKVTVPAGGKTVVLTEGMDYRVLYRNNVNAGKGTVIVKGNGAYKGEITKDFTIAPKPVGKLKILTGGMGLNSTAEVFVYVYDGGKMLEPGVDYEIKGRPDTSSKGKKDVTISMVDGGNYTGSKTVKVEVYDSDKILGIDNVAMKNPADSAMAYTGKALKPEVVVSYDGATLDKKSYSVKYMNNKEAGTAYIIVTGKKGYAGCVVATFEIKPVKSKFELKKGSIPAATYNGKLQKPKTAIAIGGKALKAGKDYILLYSDDLHAGTAHVTVKGLGNYADTPDQVFDFTINPQKIGKASVKGSKGKLEVTYAKKALREGVDFTVSYGAENKGKVEVTLNGINDFTDKVTKKVKL